MGSERALGISEGACEFRGGSGRALERNEGAPRGLLGAPRVLLVAPRGIRERSNELRGEGLFRGPGGSEGAPIVFWG